MKLIINNSFIRFLLVGIINTIIGLSSTLFLLNIVGLSYFLSTCFGNIIGAIASYFLNKTFTFKNKSPIINSAWRFALITLICYTFSYSTSYYISSSELLAHIISNKKIMENIAVLTGSALYTITNYLGHRFFTFKKYSI